MYKYFTIFLLLISIVTVFITCSRSFSDDQLHFGILAARKELWDEAIFRWKKVIQSDPNSAAAHNNLAVAYEKKGLWKEAKEEYEIALKLRPNDKQIIANFESFKESYDPFEQKSKNEKK